MFPSEGYFYVKSQKNGLFVSVDGEDEGDDDSQKVYSCGVMKMDIWFLSKLQWASIMMDIEGGDLKSDKRVLQYNRKKTMTHNQRWGIRDGFVYVVADPRLVLDTQEDEGSYITVAVKKSEENDLQQWYLEPYEGDC
ncbi:hypothetical protein INT47_009392 [Mucor saturninus]|uniref:Ricin B lectin domain-containing protein n=1 Tax=Mucor saturninus TaxID=64648 RepID=A0A8H7V234_9FUNG|nr:hypothetical protein INT47_009392 [Mucor saturninus]